MQSAIDATLDGSTVDFKHSGRLFVAPLLGVDLLAVMGKKFVRGEFSCGSLVKPSLAFTLSF